jgi:CRISPR system Cascade subunit CasC
MYMDNSMTLTRFLQINCLTSYPASLLNRDDSGFAKRIPFGGTTRTRCSSQSLKYHWRSHDGEYAISGIEGVELSVRSRVTFESEVFAKLVAEGVPEVRADVLTKALLALVLGKSDKAAQEETDEEDKPKKSKKSKKSEPESRESIQTNQVTVFGRPELSYLFGEALKIATTPTFEALFSSPEKVKEAVSGAVEAHFKSKDHKANLKALKLGAGIDATLFGRMVTGDILARCDAAIHVSHAFTVHEEATESDYWSAVDTLSEAAGSAHINSSELTTGLFHIYICVDIPLLVSNLGGDLALAGEVLARLVHTVSTVSIGAKLGSTAPHTYAQMVLVEAGNSQPCTMANAFANAVSTNGSLLANAYDALARFVTDLDAMYGSKNKRVIAMMGPREKLAGVFPAPVTLAEVADFARAVVSK